MTNSNRDNIFNVYKHDLFIVFLWLSLDLLETARLKGLKALFGPYGFVAGGGWDQHPASCTETDHSIMPAGSPAALMYWVTQSHSGRYRCSVTDHPGAQRHGQEVQVTVEGENAMWGRHGSIDWTTSSPSWISFVLCRGVLKTVCKTLRSWVWLGSRSVMCA